eukprot:TRINITY_DN41882_c0_g1_i1.p2 TRINITY_DN41882_c0_g1~~TRINITY_DN41882_c0_g1_i1.p2  ORF type:complete len:495 (-),score=146.60 TRINITY_DN41882_c0_g1_i1:153-1637(-)
MSGGELNRPSAGRPDQYKRKSTRESEAARRREALAAQQSEARAARLADIRRIATDALVADEKNDLEVQCEVAEVDDEAQDGEADADMGEGRSKKRESKKTVRMRKLHRTLFFARQFQQPDWMVEVPSDLCASWLVSVRPEGDRCLLCSQNGKVQIRRKNGYILERYYDARFPPGLTILDCVVMESTPSASSQAPAPMADAAETQEAEPDDAEMDAEEDVGAAAEADCAMNGAGQGRGYGKGKGRGKGAGKGKGKGKGVIRKYAICDVLVWGDNDLVCAEAECRMYWLESRFAEMEEHVPKRARKLELVKSVPAALDAVHEAYTADVGYVKDALMFVHRDSHYCMSEAVTPLVLTWRDRQISRYVVDTPDPTGQTWPEKQAVVLELRNGGYLRTADRALVAQVSKEQQEEMVKLAGGGVENAKLGHHKLFRFEVDRVDVENRQLHGLKPVAFVPSRSRIWPDAWNRIAFQALYRQGRPQAISWEALKQAAAGFAA